MYTALLDANVIYPASIRDVLLQLAFTNQYRARWSDDIHEEWIESLLRNEPRQDRAALERTRDNMNRAIRDCLVTGYQSLIPSLTLPDSNDRHVLAAAIIGKCDVIITKNVRDFPREALEPFEIEAQDPDEFLCHQLDLAPGNFCSAIREIRTRLENPPYTVGEYLDRLTEVGLVATTAELKPFANLL